MNNFVKGTGWGGQGDAPEGEEPKVKTAIQSLKEVSDQVKKLKSPTGEKIAPARTCRELAANVKDGYKQPEDGLYWIDPNGGGISDAIQVQCEFKFGDKLDKTQTCLTPTVETYEKKTWFRSPPRNDNAKLFAERHAESQEFRYTTHKSQVKFLRQLSRQAKQRIFVQCKNMIAYEDESGNTDLEIKLIGADEEEMKSTGNKAFRYKVQRDECKTKNGQWGETVFEVKGRSKINRLPIMDIAFSDVGSGQEFGVKVGKVCFSG